MAAKKVKNISVSFLKMGDDAGTKDLKLASGSTLEAVLLKAGMGGESLSSILEGVRINGRAAELSTKVKDGDFVTVAPQVKGGC